MSDVVVVVAGLRCWFATSGDMLDGFKDTAATEADAEPFLNIGKIYSDKNLFSKFLNFN